MTTTPRDTLLAELREHAADRPAHAAALEQLIAWYEKWAGNMSAAPAATQDPPRGVSNRVAEALNDDVAHAFWGASHTQPPRAYTKRRATGAHAAAARDNVRAALHPAEETR